MKTLHFDCFAGISGDMTLGAMADLGIDTAKLIHELQKLGLEGWALRFEKDQRNGITGTHAIVDLGDDHSHIAHDHEHSEHEHHHDDEHHHEHEHHHHHEHEHTHEHHEHAHNSWKDIRALIEGSAISAGAKSRAIKIFTKIAEAEAKVHGRGVDDVAFHEVGAMDSIIDIVGTAIALDMLAPDRITCGEVELGGGTVLCAHGELPVPAPATLLLVQGMPVKTGGFNKEMTTPTGAGILAAMVDEFIDSNTAARFTELKTGCGIGTRKMEKANVLRVSLRDTASADGGEKAPWNTETLTLIETNIDDMTGEAFGFLMERLFEAGALDVTFTPCVMKKSRPGTVVSVLTPPEKLDALRRALFVHSTSIGFRETEVRRLSLERNVKTIGAGETSARQKTVALDGKPLRSKIEYDDRAAYAREHNIPLAEAERQLTRS